jgi:hypothetical protein
VDLTFPSDGLIVVAGIPGAGKTTLIRRAVDRDVATVVDTDDRREAGTAGPLPLLYGGHYARILAGIAGPGPVVVHTRGTHAWLRRGLVAAAALRGRPACLVLLDAPRAAAEAGQRHRGRTIGAAAMARQADRWARLVAEPDALRREGWSSVAVLDRPAAASVERIAFLPAVEPVPVPAA